MLVTLRIVSSRLDHNTELSTSDFVPKSQKAIQDLLALIVDLDAEGSFGKVFLVGEVCGFFCFEELNDFPDYPLYFLLPLFRLPKVWVGNLGQETSE